MKNKGKQQVYISFPQNVITSYGNKNTQSLACAWNYVSCFMCAPPNVLKRTPVADTVFIPCIKSEELGCVQGHTAVVLRK